MPSNKEIQQRIINAIEAKMGKIPNCSLCGHGNWSIGDHYVVLSTSKNPTQTKLGGNVLPFSPMVCLNCGNTHFINLLSVGFAPEDLQSLEFGEDGKK